MKIVRLAYQEEWWYSAQALTEKNIEVIVISCQKSDAKKLPGGVEKKVSVIAVPSLMRRLNCSMELPSEVDETTDGIKRRCEWGTFTLGKWKLSVPKKNYSVENLSFCLVCKSLCSMSIRVVVWIHLLDALTPFVLDVAAFFMYICGNESVLSNSCGGKYL